MSVYIYIISQTGIGEVWYWRRQKRLLKQWEMTAGEYNGVKYSKETRFLTY